MTIKKETLNTWYSRLIDEEDDARVCKDIPKSSCTNIPVNFFLIIVTQLMTKLADSLANAKTVLPWLLTATGAPAGFTALLVPIRESGSLIPQLLIGGYIRRYAIRKYFFVFGCVAQAICLVSMLLCSIYLEGVMGGVAIIASLIMFSLARGICSIASKDVIGKTIPKTRRGTQTGISTSLSGIITMGVAIAMILGLMSNSNHFAILLLAAAVCWVIGALFYAQVQEARGATSGSENGIKHALGRLSLLKTDKPFRKFVIMRALLMSSGLAAPFFVTLTMSQENIPQGIQLGLFVGLSGLASMVSGHIWGKWSDKNSLLVMTIAGFSCALICIIAIVGMLLNITYIDILALVLFFLLMVSHQGVRVGRKTYLIDLATGNKRTDYTAVGNSLIGVLLLGAGLITMLIAQFSTLLVFAFFALCCVLAGLLGIKEQLQGNNAAD